MDDTNFHPSLLFLLLLNPHLAAKKDLVVKAYTFPNLFACPGTHGDIPVALQDSVAALCEAMDGWWVKLKNSASL